MHNIKQYNNILTKNVSKCARVLSKDFDYIRLDFYNVDGVLFFGEYIFFPPSSHIPLLSKEVDKYLGKIYQKLSSSD